MRKSGRAYDCISGLSGGKDSSYAIYLCQKFGLRQLTVTFDNSFISKEARYNIDAITKNLSVDHIVVKPNWKYLRKLYRHCILKAGEFCSVCNVGIRAALYRTAVQYGIRSIIAGSSPRTEANFTEKFSCCSNDYFKNVFKSLLTRKDINEFMFIGQIKRGLWHLTGKLAWVQLPRYLPWKEPEILSVLSSKADWQGSLWEQHTDCIMSDAKEYLQYKRYGFMEKTAKLSSLVRDQQMTKEKALESIAKAEATLLDHEKEICDKISATFELNKEELQQALSQKHWEYLPQRKGIYNKAKQLLYK
jgi:tRNA(Ile)-lysidine synthase TilS/MesJ